VPTANFPHLYTRLSPVLVLYFYACLGVWIVLFSWCYPTKFLFVFLLSVVPANYVFFSHFILFFIYSRHIYEAYKLWNVSMWYILSSTAPPCWNQISQNFVLKFLWPLSFVSSLAVIWTGTTQKANCFEYQNLENFNWTLKAVSHIVCRAHAVPLPRHALIHTMPHLCPVPTALCPSWKSAW
jgi:hypothetical protein